MSARLAFAAVVLLAAATPAVASDFMDTTLTFVAGDDNVRAGAGETIPSSPRMDFRPRQGNSLFFENYNTRNTGEETRGELCLYKEFAGYYAGVVPEASMVLQWDDNRMARDTEQYQTTSNRKTYAGLKDDGSYLAIHFDGAADPGVDGKGKPPRFSVILFPFDSDRFRLGYSWELTWGGRGSFLLANYVPGAMVAYKSANWYSFLGGKTARTQWFTASETDIHRDESETIYGVLGGGGVHVIPNLLLELSGGYFDKGTIPIETGTVQGTWIRQFGASTQITWHDGIEPKVPVDTKLLRNVGGDLRPRDWKPKAFGYLISLEATVTSQELESYDTHNATRETGYAGDINTAVQDGRFTYNLDFVTRSVQFLVQDTPGIFPYGAVSKEMDITPEFFASAGMDYTMPDWRFVPGVSFGVQRPASALVQTRQADGTRAPANIVLRKTKNVLGETQVFPSTLPAGDDVALIYAGKLYLREYLSDLVNVVAQVQLSYDLNQVTNDPDSGARKFDSPLVLGINVLAQAKF